MARYANYDDCASRTPQWRTTRGLVIEPGTRADLHGIAEIAAAREGSTIRKQLGSFRRFLRQSIETGECMLWVARLRGEIIGFAKCGLFVPERDAPLNTAPKGWYLLGMVVAPKYRRRRAGLRLTEARLNWIAERSANAYY